MMNKILAPLTPLVLLSVLLTALSFSLSVQAGEVSLANPNTNNDGSIDFFIPIKNSTSGNYGDLNNNVCATGVGTCSDSVHIDKNNKNSSGWLNLELMFNVPANKKVTTLEVSFFDLDLNDYRIGNSWFWETAEFYYGGNSLAQLNRIQDGSSSSTNNTNNKAYNFSLDISNLGITGGMFSIGLKLTANLTRKWKWDKKYNHGITFRNTKESLSAKVSYRDAKVTSVPEPSTLILFALALVGFATGRLKQA